MYRCLSSGDYPPWKTLARPSYHDVMRRVVLSEGMEDLRQTPRRCRRDLFLDGDACDGRRYG